MFPVHIFIHSQLMHDVFLFIFVILLRCSFFLNNRSRVVQLSVLPLVSFVPNTSSFQQDVQNFGQD